MSARDDASRPGDAPRREFSLPPNPDRLAADLDEELRFHMEGRREQLIAQGMTPDQADAEVRRRFGNVDAYRRETREIDTRAWRSQRRAAFLGSLWRETRRSARLLLRERAFSALALGTLALGLGATIAMFAVLDSVVLKPLPYPDAGGLVSVLHPASVPGSGERKWGVSPGGYFHFRDHAKSFSDFGIYRTYDMTVSSGGDAELGRFAITTSGVLRALRARAAQGRLFVPEDEVPGAPFVALLSHEYHQQRFGGDPGVVGTMLETGHGPIEIVGITEPGLTLPMPGPFADASNLAGFGVDVWIQMRLDPAGPFYNNHPNVGIGRLADGVGIDAANAELSTLLQRFPEWMPIAYTERWVKNFNFRVEVQSLRATVLGAKIPRVLWMLFGSVLLVLVIAAANVGSLFLARMEMRRREAAVRAALGADRTQMAAHFLSESLLLCLASAVAGLAIAAAVINVVVAIAPTDIPRLADTSIGASGVAFGLGVALLLGLVLGVLPLLRKGLDVGALRDGGRTLAASPRQRLARSGLVTGQIALTMVLLAAAGLMLRSFDTLRRVSPGFDPSNTLAFEFSLPFTAYDTREKALVFHRELRDRVLSLPGVVAFGAGQLPLEDFGTGCASVFRENRPYPAGESAPCVPTPIVLPGYFDALGIEVKGHRPDWSDVDSRSQATVVTRALADRLWPGEDPIGKGIFQNGFNNTRWYRVTGVIEEIRAESLEQAPTEGAFYAASGFVADERTDILNDLTFLVRTNGADPAALVPSIRAILKELDPKVPFVSARTMEQVVARSLARSRFMLVLLGVAAFIALALSAVGTYGVVSYLVTQRRVEIGIRMALGATVPQVVRMVVVQSVRLALVGVVVGTVSALAGTRVMQSVLFEVSPTDPGVLATVGLLLLAVVLTASFAPARRAARIQPVEAMRG